MTYPDDTIDMNDTKKTKIMHSILTLKGVLDLLLTLVFIVNTVGSIIVILQIVKIDGDPPETDRIWIILGISHLE